MGLESERRLAFFKSFPLKQGWLYHGLSGTVLRFGRLWAVIRRLQLWWPSLWLTPALRRTYLYVWWITGDGHEHSNWVLCCMYGLSCNFIYLNSSNSCNSLSGFSVLLCRWRGSVTGWACLRATVWTSIFHLPPWPVHLAAAQAAQGLGVGSCVTITLPVTCWEPLFLFAKVASID